MPFTPSDFYLSHLAPLHQKLLSDPISNDYFNGSGIRFDGSELQPDDQFELSFGEISTVEFAHLFSVFDGSRVHQQSAKEAKHDAPPGLYFTITNNHLIQSPYKNRLGIYKDDQGETDLYIESLHIDHFFLNKHRTPPTLGTVAFALCAITAHLAGLSQISLIAAGGRGFSSQYIGYKIWPKFGFDAPLEAEEVLHAPHLTHCSSVQDVLATDPVWWETHGYQRLMTFDLSPSSTSWQKMLPYVHGKLTNGRTSHE